MTFLKECQEPPVIDHGAHTSCLPYVWGAWPEPPLPSAVADLHQHLSIPLSLPPFLLLPSTPPAEPGFLSDATCTSKSIPVLCFKQMNPSPAFFPSLPITRTASAVNASIPPHSSFFQFIFFAFLSGWKMDFCPFCCLRKCWHCGASEDFLNKDS